MVTQELSMHIDILHHNVLMRPEDEKYIRRKLAHLQKYAERLSDESSRCRVEFRESKLKSSGESIACEVTLFVPQSVIRAEVSSIDVRSAIDLALDKLKKQIQRYKSRWANWEKKKDQQLRDLKISDFVGISKRKEYSHIQSMQEAEAIERMELLGHDFFLFMNADTDRFSVVYKREDSTYGLIQPGL